jgi:hypothetical protein
LTYFRSLFSFVVLLSLLFGCSNDTNDNQPLSNEKELQSNTENKQQLDFVMIASEKTLPTNFHDIAFERKTDPLFQYLVRKVINQLSFEETWNLFGFENKIPNVDLDEKNVFFIGVHESGSCPYKIRNIELGSDNKTITVPLSEPGGVCTFDATPRSFVIEIDKEISKIIDSVVIVQSGVETIIPIEN